MAHHLARYPTPFEVAPALDADLRFAAEMTAQGRGKLREQRRAFIGALRELKRR